MLQPPRIRMRSLTLAAATSVFMLTAVCGLGQGPPEITAREREYVEDMLLQVHQTLKQNYYDKSFHGVDIEARYQACRARMKDTKTVVAAYVLIETYLAGLDDSHTSFIPPPNSRHVSYGFRFQMIGDRCYITKVQPGTDAAQKLHQGDQLLSLDGYEFNRTDLWRLQYVLYLSHPQITQLRLRDVAGNIRQESVAAEFYQRGVLLENGTAQGRLAGEQLQQLLGSRSAEQGDVLFWKLPAFRGDEGAISHMLGQARKHKALVLDLRGNNGGSESMLMLILSNLFDHDVVIGKRITRNGEKAMVAKSAGHSAFSGQLIVLVDSRSASAAELLARMVQIEHRGIVLGDQTEGSVKEAEIYPLKEGVGLVFPFAVEITKADLIMTDGKSLEKLGVTPDEILLPTPKDLEEGLDPVLARAAELAGVRIDPAAAGKMFPFEWPPAKLTAR